MNPAHPVAVEALHIVTQVDWDGADGAGFGPFDVERIDALDALRARLADGACDALLLRDGADALDLVGAIGKECAVLVVVADPVDGLGATPLIAWLARGAQDVLSADELAAPAFARRLRMAVERQRRECEAATAYATDLGTGLPHQQQLVEHMSQLLALREREPAPMALIALRVEGFAATEARFGREAANVLRRKVGVRLRAGVRASDVVAALDDDGYAVLLGSILTPADAGRVGAKLLAALAEPLRVAGHDVGVAVAIGIGQYPQDGTQPDALLRRAVGLAAAAPAQGRAGFANFGEPGVGGGSAANDE